MTSAWIEVIGSGRRQRCAVRVDENFWCSWTETRFCQQGCQKCDEVRGNVMARCPPGLFADIHAMERFDWISPDEIGPLRALEPWLRHIRGAIEMLRCWDAGDASARLALLDFLKDNGHEDLAAVCEAYTF